MRRIRFILFAFVSFLTVLFDAFFSPGTFLNRILAVAICSVLSFNASLCTTNFTTSSERVIAASSPAVERTITDNSRFYEAYTVSQNSTNTSPQSTQTSNTTKKPKALILAPFHWEVEKNSESDPSNDIEKLLKENGFDIVAKYNKKITDKNLSIEDFINWEDYDVIFIVSHGSYDSLSTYINANQSIKDKYEIDLNGDGNPDTLRESQKYPNTLIITSEFIKTYTKVKPNSLIYLHACGCGRGNTNSVAKTLSDKDRSIAVIGYTDLINIQGSSDEPIKVFEALLQGNKTGNIPGLGEEASGIRGELAGYVRNKPQLGRLWLTGNRNLVIPHPKPIPPQKTGKLKQGTTHGDPHIIAFDGKRYSFQTVGEFILVKSTDGNFEVQVRQSPISPSLSLNSAVAMKVGSTRVTFYSKDFPDSDTTTPLRINGVSIAMQGDSLPLADGGTIRKSGNTYVVGWPTGEKVTANIYRSGDYSYIDVSTFVFDSEAGQFTGLLGNLNNNPDDDQQIRGGSALTSRSTYGDLKRILNTVGVTQLPFSLAGAERLYFEQLYKDFGNSWRISQAESLFDYPSGKTTENFTDRRFPDEYLTLEMLPPERLRKAQAECQKAKVDQNLMEGCIFDVGFSGLSEFARTTAKIDKYINIVQQLFPGVGVPTVNSVIDRVVPRQVCLPFVGCREIR